MIRTQEGIRWLVMVAAAMSVSFGWTAGGADAKSRTPETVAAALNVVGIQRLKDGDAVAAVQKFEEALAVDPKCIAATRNLSKLLAAAKRYDKAVAVLEAGLANAPQDEGCLVQLAQIHAATGHASEFKSVLARVSQLPNVKIRRDLPVLLLNQGSVAYAAMAIETALSLEPENPVCWYNKGVIAEAANEDKAAETAYRRALKLRTEYFSAWINLGNVLDAQKRPDEATQAYQRAYELDSKNSYALYNYGRMLVIYGKDIKKGFAMVREASECKGGASEPARRLLKRLVEIANKESAK